MLHHPDRRHDHDNGDELQQHAQAHQLVGIGPAEIPAAARQGDLADRVLKAGGDPGKVVFSGVGKRDDEIAFPDDRIATDEFARHVAARRRRIPHEPARDDEIARLKWHVENADSEAHKAKKLAVAESELRFKADEEIARLRDAGEDVVVLDVRLPDGNGIDLCRDIRSRWPTINCLMLTSFADPCPLCEGRGIKLDVSLID